MKQDFAPLLSDVASGGHAEGSNIQPKIVILIRPCCAQDRIQTATTKERNALLKKTNMDRALATHRGVFEIARKFAPLSTIGGGEGAKNRKPNPDCKIPKGHIENVRNGYASLVPSPGTGKKEHLKETSKESRPMGHGE